MSADVSLLHGLLDESARTWPENMAVSRQGADEPVYTYEALRQASLRLACWLSGIGVARGDRVVILSSATPVVAALIFSVARVGAVFTVLHEQVRGRSLDHVLGDCEPTLVVSDDPGVLDATRRHGIRTGTIAEARKHASATDTSGWRTQAITARMPLPVDPVCLIYTSGTTSLPKAVVSTHQQVLFATKAIQSMLRYRSDDVVYCPLPLSFDYGLYQLFLGAASGAQIALSGSGDAGPALLRGLIDANATILPAVPSVAESLAWLLTRSPGRVPPLRLITNTGAAISGGTLDTLRAAVPGLSAQVMYGLTECKRAAIMPPDGDLVHPDSCGLALLGTEIFVIDEEGKRLPPGATGEIVIRGPNVMSGYWRRPELTDQKFPRRDGLFPELRTGDYGTVDAEGYVYFSGRRDDQYKVRGFRVSATEVEAAAYRIPGVVSAAVLLPSENKPATLVVVGETTSEHVLDLMRNEIEEYKIPRRCFVLDELPLGQNGKVDRRALASLI